MRKFFIPGFGEEPSIFDKIQFSFTGEKIFIDNWTLLVEVPEKDLTALRYAKFLIDRYKITRDDVIIGHSSGAWVALWVKELLGCRIVQIAGFTNRKKVIKISPDLHLLYCLAKKGWGLNNFTRLIISIVYTARASKPVILKIFDKIKSSDKRTLAKQLMVVYNPIKQAITVPVDLRIHTSKDFIVTPPAEAFAEVPGDHFALYTYPESVSKPIVEFLRQ